MCDVSRDGAEKPSTGEFNTALAHQQQPTAQI